MRTDWNPMRLKQAGRAALCVFFVLLLGACVSKPDAPMAERSAEKYFFNNRDMDYYTLWIQGREIFDGSERSEFLPLVSRIVDGDTASWEREWSRLAEETEAKAASLLSGGEQESARKAFLRACTYYRAPLFVMDPEAPNFRTLISRMQGCFSRAARLFDPPIESVQVPYDGKAMPGYFWKPDGGMEKRPTILLVGGMETWLEDCYFIIGRRGGLRGYNVLAVDLPGQGMNPDQGLYLESRAERGVKALVDYAAGRAEIDTERMALFGISWGGYIVLKGAVDEPRLKAVIADPATPDIWSFCMSQQSGVTGDPIKTNVFRQLSWRFGVRISDFFGRIALAMDYNANGKADPARISCPVFCIAGDGESAEAKRQTDDCFARLPNPDKKLMIFTKADGTETHCQVDNLGLLDDAVLDWLDSVLKDPRP